MYDHRHQAAPTVEIPRVHLAQALRHPQPHYQPPPPPDRLGPYIPGIVAALVLTVVLCFIIITQTLSAGAPAPAVEPLPVLEPARIASTLPTDTGGATGAFGVAPVDETTPTTEAPQVGPQPALSPVAGPTSTEEPPAATTSTSAATTTTVLEATTTQSPTTTRPTSATPSTDLNDTTTTTTGTTSSGVVTPSTEPPNTETTGEATDG